MSMPMRNERDVFADHSLVTARTLEKVIPLESRFSYFNHRHIWMDLNKKTYYTLKSILERLCSDVKRYWWYKSGQSPQAMTLPKNEQLNAGPCMIIGSGPSLDDNINILEDWHGGIVCSTSQASTLIHAGVDPTHIVCFDPFVQIGEFRVPRWPEQTILVTHPGIHPEVIQAWRRMIYYYRVYDPFERFYASVMPNAYPFIDVEVIPYANSIATQIQIAHFMGYDPLILVGCDFAYLNDKQRFTNWDYDKKTRQWIETKHPLIPGDTKGGLVVSEGGMLTEWMHLYYRKTVGAVVYLDTPNIIDCSEGLLTGLFQRHDLSEIVKTGGNCLIRYLHNRDAIRSRLEPWLAAQGTYYIPMQGGKKLVDVPDWEKGMPLMVAMLNDQANAMIDVHQYMAYVAELHRRFEEIDYGKAKPAKRDAENIARTADQLPATANES